MVEKTVTTPEQFGRMRAFLIKNIVSAMAQGAPEFARGFQEILVYIEEKEAARSHENPTVL